MSNQPFITDDELYSARFGNPIVFLGAFLGMSARRDRYKIGFDAASLDWISDVWSTAALTAAGDSRLRDACLHEAARYKALSDDLKNGQRQNGVDGVAVLNEPNDWPRKDTIKEAIRCLAYAQITSVH